jgi:hypothetical protein
MAAIVMVDMEEGIEGGSEWGFLFFGRLHFLSTVSDAWVIHSACVLMFLVIICKFLNSKEAHWLGRKKRRY